MENEKLTEKPGLPDSTESSNVEKQINDENLSRRIAMDAILEALDYYIERHNQRRMQRDRELTKRA